MTMTHTAQETHQDERRGRAGALRCLGAFLVGVLGCVGLTAPLSADLRPVTGEWAMIAVYAVYGAFLARSDLRTRRLPDTLTLTLAAALLGAVLGLAITTGDVGAAAAAIAGGIGLALLLTVIALAYVLALPHAVIGGVLRSRGRVAVDLPFGPYMIAAGMIVAIASTLSTTVGHG